MRSRLTSTSTSTFYGQNAAYSLAAPARARRSASARFITAPLLVRACQPYRLGSLWTLGGRLHHSQRQGQDLEKLKSWGEQDVKVGRH
jgi:hypothetical protein